MGKPIAFRLTLRLMAGTRPRIPAKPTLSRRGEMHKYSARAKRLCIRPHGAMCPREALRTKRRKAKPRRDKGRHSKTQNRRIQHFRRGEEKRGNAPRREPKADATSDVLTKEWENRDRNNIRHRHALRRRRLRRARKRRAKRQKFKNTLRSCLTSPSTTWVIIASFRMPGSSRSKKRGDAVTGKQDGESAKESGPEEQSQRSEQDRPRADRQQFDDAGALKRRQESLRHQGNSPLSSDCHATPRVAS